MIAAVGLIATISACVGGIRAVIWTDVLQAAMLFGGVFVIIGYVAWDEGTRGRDVVVDDCFASRQGTAAAVGVGRHYGADDGALGSHEHHLFGTSAPIAAIKSLCSAISRPTVCQQRRKSFIVNIVSAATIGTLLSVSGLACDTII